MENTAKLLEDSLLLIWNDRNAEKRLEAMKKIYAYDIVFYESNEGPVFKGYQAINDLISELQSKWPLEFKFEMNGPSRVNHEIQQVSWTLGIPGQAPAATGMDIAVIEDRQIKSLHAFLDAPAN